MDLPPASLVWLVPVSRLRKCPLSRPGQEALVCPWVERLRTLIWMPSPLKRPCLSRQSRRKASVISSMENLLTIVSSWFSVTFRLSIWSIVGVNSSLVTASFVAISVSERLIANIA